MTDGNPTETCELKLYIANMNPTSRRAVQNLKRICAEYLEGKYSLEIVDLLKNPERAKSDQIAAIPALIRVSPLPIRKLIGDLSDTEKVISSLELAEKSCPSV